jgi:hypothetical protein
MGAHLVSMFWGGGCQQTQKCEAKPSAKTRYPKIYAQLTDKTRGRFRIYCRVEILNLYGTRSYHPSRQEGAKQESGTFAHDIKTFCVHPCIMLIDSDQCFELGDGLVQTSEVGRVKIFKKAQRTHRGDPEDLGEACRWGQFIFSGFQHRCRRFPPMDLYV